MWSYEEVLKLIEVYKEKPGIWNPSDPGYSRKDLRNRAWEDIAQSQDKAVEDCKQKMINLLAAFRREKRKINYSRKIAKGTDDVYVSRWFAYEALKFLEDRGDTPKKPFPKKAKDQEPVDKPEDEQTQSPILGDDLDEILPTSSISKPITEIQNATTSSSVKRKQTNMTDCTPSKTRKTSCNFHFESLNSGTEDISNRTAPASNEDVFDSFGKYVASLLRGIRAPTAFRLQERITSMIIDTIYSSPTPSCNDETKVRCDDVSNESDVSDDCYLFELQ